MAVTNVLQGFDVSGGRSHQGFKVSSDGVAETVLSARNADVFFSGANKGDGGSLVHVSDTGFITGARMVREGPDLVLSLSDGRTVRIAGYFSGPVRPDIQGPDGSVLSADLVESFMENNSPIQLVDNADDAYALLATLGGEAIGTVESLSGVVMALRLDGSRVTLQAGDPVYQGDRVETSASGAVKMVFVDETVFSLGSDARIALDEMIYDPATQSGESAFSILKGGFLFISGHIAKTNPDSMSVSTPVATIGIRGTIVAGEVLGAGDEVFRFTVIDGAIDVSRNGETYSLSDNFSTLYALDDGGGSAGSVRQVSESARDVVLRNVEQFQVLSSRDIATIQQDVNRTLAEKGIALPPEVRNLQDVIDAQATPEQESLQQVPQPPQTDQGGRTLNVVEREEQQAEASILTQSPQQSLLRSVLDEEEFFALGEGEIPAEVFNTSTNNVDINAIDDNATIPPASVQGLTLWGYDAPEAQLSNPNRVSSISIASGEAVSYTSPAKDLNGGVHDDKIYGYYDKNLTNSGTITVHNKIDGGAGNDELHGMFGGTIINSGQITNNNIIIGGDGDDIIYGLTAGNVYTISGTIIDNDTISGGAGNDVIYDKNKGLFLYGVSGGSDNDTINGGTGDDIIHISGGVDIVDGGSGKDSLIVHGLSGFVGATMIKGIELLDISQTYGQQFTINNLTNFVQTARENEAGNAFVSTTGDSLIVRTGGGNLKTTATELNKWTAGGATVSLDTNNDGNTESYTIYTNNDDTSLTLYVEGNIQT